MNILDSASQTEKELVLRIVDNYRGTYKNMQADCNSIFGSPGCWLHSLFYDSNLSPLSCNIIFSDNNGRLWATFVLSKEEDANDFFQRINLKKASFIEQIYFLKNLLYNNLIYFEKDYDCGLRPYNDHSEHDLAKWSANGLKYYDEEIKNHDIFDFLNKFYWSRVIPSSTLMIYRDHKFKTVDARRHRTNSWLSRAGIASAFVIALGSPWLMTKCSKSHIEDKQYNLLIESINKVYRDSKIDTPTSDTILVIKSPQINGQTENAKP